MPTELSQWCIEFGHIFHPHSGMYSCKCLSPSRADSPIQAHRVIILKSNPHRDDTTQQCTDSQTPITGPTTTGRVLAPSFHVVPATTKRAGIRNRTLSLVRRILEGGGDIERQQRAPREELYRLGRCGTRGGTIGCAGTRGRCGRAAGQGRWYRGRNLRRRAGY